LKARGVERDCSRGWKMVSALWERGKQHRWVF
jgi:hypothetical protein